MGAFKISRLFVGSAWCNCYTESQICSDFFVLRLFLITKSWNRTKKCKSIAYCYDKRIGKYVNLKRRVLWWVVSAYSTQQLDGRLFDTKKISRLWPKDIWIIERNQSGGGFLSSSYKSGVTCASFVNYDTRGRPVFQPLNDQNILTIETFSRPNKFLSPFGWWIITWDTNIVCRMQIFCKNMFHKKFFLRRRSSKKNSRQYLLSVAFYERSLLIVREIFFFKSIFWKLTYSRFKRRNYMPFMNFFLEMMALKNPPNFKRFLPSFPVA